MTTCNITDEVDERMNSPYFAKVEEILGGSFTQVRSDILVKIGQQEEVLGREIEIANPGFVLDDVKNDEDLIVFAVSRLKYAFSGDVPSEFLAVLGEFYYFGKEYFYRVFGQFFAVDVVDKLYEFTREEIFNGKEY